ncbi:MAG: PH domain-containing protein [Dysgonamonadaceae bacterium]|jgi:hypothetical protein|nr:PH domain-containing protein [Dysgonamonadaceae bacterium]
MNFQCSWDSTVISITAITSVVVLSVAIMFLVKMVHYKRNEEKLYAGGCLLGAVLSIIALSFPALYTPLSVSVKDKTIQIHRIVGNIVIPFNEIAEIRRTDASDTKNSTRKFGSGGDFGYLGKFSSSQLGNYQMYATDASKRILVKNNKGECLIFSCDRPEELLKMVNSVIPTIPR